MDAKRIVNEAIGDPGEIAKFVHAALPDIHLDDLVSVTDDAASGGWEVTVRGQFGHDSWLGLINFHHFAEDGGDGNLYYVEPESFVDAYMNSKDWTWKDGGKWVKRMERNQCVYFPSMRLAKRSLLKEPMVQRRIARLTNLTQPAVESIAIKGVVRERRLDRVVAMMETDGWTIKKSGFHANGRAYVIGTGECHAVHDVVESVDTSADCAHLFVENIQPARKSDSSPWQIDFTILQDAEEDTEELSAEELSDLVLKDTPGIPTRQLLRRIHTLLKPKLPSLAVTVGHSSGLAEEPRKLYVSFGISDHYPLHEPKTEANSVSSASSLAAVKEVISELGIHPYGMTPDSQFSIKHLHPATKDGWFIQFVMAGPEDYTEIARSRNPHWVIDESQDVSMFRGVIRKGAEDTPGFKDTQRLYAIKDALEEQGFTVHQVWQKPGSFYTPTQARQVDVSVVFSWPEPMAGYKVEEKVIDAFYDKDINYKSSLYFTTIFDRPNTGLVSFYCSSYDEPDKRRSLSFDFTPMADVDVVKESVGGIDIAETWTARDLVRQTDPSHPARVGMAAFAELLAAEGLHGSVGVSSTREQGIIQVQFGLTFAEAELDKAEGYKGYELVPLYAGQWDTTILKAIHKAFDPQGFRYAQHDSHLIEYNQGTANGGKHFALIGRFYPLVPKDLIDLHVKPFTVRVKIGESKETDAFMQSYLSKWRVGKHEWGSGSVTYYAYKGIGNKAPDDKNRHTLNPGLAFNKSYVNAFVAYMNWLEKAFMPSDRFATAKEWTDAADLAGKMQKWLKMVKAHKAPIPPVEESRWDDLRAATAVATPLANERSDLSALSHHFYDLGCRKGRITLKFTPYGDELDLVRLSGHVAPIDSWRSIYHDARPAVQDAIRKHFPDYQWDGITVSSSAGSEDVAFHCQASVPKKPDAAHKLKLSAVVGKDAEYHQAHLAFESMDPAELVSRAIPDIRFHNVMLGIAAELKRCGCKGKVTLSTAGFDAPQPGQAPQQNVEITASLTKMPGDWYVGRAFKTHFSDIVHEEFKKHPDLPQYKKIAYGSIGSDEEVHIFVEYAVPGLFAYKHPKVYRLEGMTPNELYRRSIIGTKLDMMTKMRAVAHKLHEMGYTGLIHVRRSQHVPSNAVIFRMYKHHQAMDGDVFKKDIIGVWKDVWGEDVPPERMGVQQMQPVDWLPWHLAVALTSPLNGYDMQRFALYGFQLESMDPAALYKKSIEGTPVEGKLLLGRAAEILAKWGYRGNIGIGRTNGGWNSVMAHLTAGWTEDTDLSDIRKHFMDAFAAIGKTLHGQVDVRTHDGGQSIYVQANAWAWPGSYRDEPIATTIAEGMDPGALYKQSIKGSPIQSNLLASEVVAALKAKGYNKCRVSIGPEDSTASNVAVYVFNVPCSLVLASAQSDQKEREAIRDCIVNAVKQAGYPDAQFVSSQLFPNMHTPEIGVLAVAVRTPGNLKLYSVDIKEGMDPHELYRQSIAHTRTGAMVMVSNIGQALIDKGYSGVELHLQPVAENWNCLFVRLENIPLNYSRHQIEEDITQVILAQDIAMDPSRRMHNFYTQGNQRGYVIVYRYLWNVLGVPRPGGISQTFGVTTTEAMDPGALYKQSLTGHLGIKLQLIEIAKNLAAKGIVGFLGADPEYQPAASEESAKLTAIHFRLYGHDVPPTKPEIEELKDTIEDAVRQAGISFSQRPMAQAPGGGYIQHLNMFFFMLPAVLNGIPTTAIKVQIGDTRGQQGYQPD